MKSCFLACIALATLVAASGCHLGRGNQCNSCGPGGAGGCGPGGCSVFGGNGGGPPAQPVAGGPPSAQVAYPYYTTRGPRDFLNPNPPSIGY